MSKDIVAGEGLQLDVGETSATLKVPDGGLNYVKLQSVSAASRLLGRGSAGGAGVIQELSLGAGLVLTGTALAVNLDTDGTLAANSDAKVPSQKAVKTYVDAAIAGGGGGGGGGITDGDKGDIVVSGTGTVFTVDANVIGNSKLAQVATATFKGRATAGSGNVEDLSAAQATALLNTFSSSLKGLAPASGGGTSNFLRADGSWAAPATPASPFVYAKDVSGYDPTGTTDSAAQIMTAEAVARAASKTLVIEGNPLVGSTLQFAHPVSILFPSGHFTPGFNEGGSFLMKKATLSGPAMVLLPGAMGSKIEGGGILGLSGNAGDGLLILAPRCALRDFGVQGVGRDGIRLGKYASGDAYAFSFAGTANANHALFERVRCGYNGQDGLVLDDQKGGGVVDANTGSFVNCELFVNGRHGLRIDKAYCGNTFTGLLSESNTGYGIRLDTNASQNFFYGGDVEANNGGAQQIYEAVALANRFKNLLEVVSGTALIRNSDHTTGSYTPSIKGQSSAGSASYSTRNGRYALMGQYCFVSIELAWSSFSGAGSYMYVDLPFAADTVSPSMPNFAPADAINQGLSLSAGSALRAAFNQNIPGIVLFAETNSGSAYVPPAASGSISVSGFYKTNLA